MKYKHRLKFIFADTNGNGYVSIGEAADYAKMVKVRGRSTPQIRNNLGASSYLVEYQFSK